MEVDNMAREGEPDPFYSAAGRLSHAVRNGLPAEEVEHRRRVLAGVRIERALALLLEEAGPPLPEQVDKICRALQHAAA